jgi:XRE family transcriptional regulator, fatty acid utilization regulator
MAERKIFAGARLKRLRQRLNLTQTQMAAAIGVSPSYLNLIERNQRPLTVQVLLKLSGVYGIDVAELSAGDSEEAVEALKEVFADPLLTGEIASSTELSEFAEAAPNAARGMTRLFEAYRESLERLSDLSHSLATSGEPASESGARLPAAQVAAYFDEAGPYFAAIEAEAETLAAILSPRDDPHEALKAHLKDRLGVELRILPDKIMPSEQLRYDRHTLRLFLSERVPQLERPFLVARQIAFLGHGSLLERLAAEAGIKEPEAARICRNAFARRLAEAILAPGERLAAAARESAFDVILLSQRFALQPSRIAQRLAALGAGGAHNLPPAFLVTLDASGAVIARISGAGFPLPRRAPLCARLPIFDPPTAGRLTHAALALSDGDAYRAIAFAEAGPLSAPLPPPRRLSLVGWRSGDVADLLGAPPGATRPVGVTCRLCERLDCSHRHTAPVAQPSAFYEHVVGPADYELAG